MGLVRVGTMPLGAGSSDRGRHAARAERDVRLACVGRLRLPMNLVDTGRDGYMAACPRSSTQTIPFTARTPPHTAEPGGRG